MNFIKLNELNLKKFQFYHCFSFKMCNLCVYNEGFQLEHIDCKLKQII